MKFSIVMPYYKRPDHLYNTLISYRHFCASRTDWELIIIEDRANAESVDDNLALTAVLAGFKDLPIRRLVSAHANQANPCRMRNEAWRESKGRIICNTNPECFLKCDALGFLDSHFPDKRPNHNTYAVACCENVAYAGRAGAYSELSQAKNSCWYDHPKHNHRMLHWFSAMTTTAYQSIGGFTDCYGDWCGYDDNDFLEKIKLAGMDIVYTLDFLVAHIDHPRGYQKYDMQVKGQAYYSRKWHRAKTGKTPILILCFERPDTLRDMIKSIEARTPRDTYEIILCDNGSTSEGMIKLLEEMDERHTVLRNGRNMGFRGLNCGLALVNEDYFIISDPDIIINSEMPETWIQDMIGVLKEKRTPKVGLGLCIDDLPDDNFGNQGRQDEKSYRNKPAEITGIKAPAFYAPIDTTFAMYRRDTFHGWINGTAFLEFNTPRTLWGDYVPQQYNPKYSEMPIRLCGKFEARHGGWYFGTKYADDYREYSRRCNVKLSSNVRQAITPEPEKAIVPASLPPQIDERKDFEHPFRLQYQGTTTAKTYEGFDDNGRVNLSCPRMGIMRASKIKARQLLTDFPALWTLISCDTNETVF